MKPIRKKSWLLTIMFACAFSPCFSQSVTGIWRGYFIADNGYQYRLEFQVIQNAKGYAVSGVSYSWQDDIRFYGKATMTGSYVGSSQNFRIREIKTVEVKSYGGGGTCIMNYNLQYTRSGKEEFLEGTYLGKQEVKEGPNPFEWGDCGGGKVYLRKVTTSEFYIEPALRPKKERPAQKPPVTKKATEKPLTPPPVAKAPARKNNTPVKKNTTTQKVVPPPVKPASDSIKKSTTEITRVNTKPVVITPTVLKTRENKLAESLIVRDPDVKVKLYDNGEIDDDTISVFLNKKLVLSNKRLSASPIKLNFTMEDGEDQELTMVAENLGRIPPNTSLMIVEAGEQRFEVRITSSEQKNAVVRFKYVKP
jgi:hypothetical protein